MMEFFKWASSDMPGTGVLTALILLAICATLVGTGCLLHDLLLYYWKARYGKEIKCPKCKTIIPVVSIPSGDRRLEKEESAS